MSLSKSARTYLNSLDDQLFLAALWLRYGTTVPVWEECSQKEYEKHNGKFPHKQDIITKESLACSLKSLLSDRIYKAEPYYITQTCGLLAQIELIGREPDGYKFYKKVGEKHVLMLGSDMIEYCQTRECMKPFFKEPI